MVIVIGGGITGLSAAYELAERAVEFRLLEAAPRLGGLVQTDHVGGFTIEAGADSMLAQKPAGIELCEALGLGPRLIAPLPPRGAFVLHRGRLHPIPSPAILGIPTTFKGIAAYDLLPPAARIRLALEPLVPAKRNDRDECVAAYFRRRFGRATVGLVAEPLLGGIHAGDIEALSMRSLFPRLVEAEARHGSVLRALRRTHHAPGREDLFKSLSSGMSELIAAIDRRLSPGSTQCNAAAEALQREGVAWTVRTRQHVFRADAVILATPAHVAARLLAGVDERAASLCSAVPYVSTATIALAWPRDAIGHRLAGSGFVVARETNPMRITACTWVSSKWEGRAPSGMALLRAYAGGAADPHAIDLDDGTLLDQVTREVSGVLSIKGPPVLSRIYRWRDAGAQHIVGQLERVEAIEGRLRQSPGVFVAGSGFRSVGIPDCVRDGRVAGAAAAGYVIKERGKAQGGR